MNKRLTVCIVVIVTFCSADTRAIQNPAIQNPVGSGRVPPSTRQSSLYPTINPIDTSGNLVITGNVRRGRHFRGILPYGSVTDFRATTSSTSIDSFLRDSAGYEDFGRHTTKRYQPQPFYSQTRTVTSFRPGQRSLMQPANISAGGSLLQRPAIPQQSKSEFLYEAYIPTRYARTRPMAPRLQDLQRAVTSEVEKYLQITKAKGKPDSQQMDEEMEKFRQDLEKAREKTAELKKNLLEPAEPSAKKTIYKFEETTEDQLQFQRLNEGEQVDVYEKMQSQIEKILEVTTPKKTRDDITSEKTDQDRQKTNGEKTLSEKLAEVDLSSAKAKEIMGKHKTFASFAEDKFNRHMRAGELFMKEGKYYRAADAYTLASLYKPNDPLAYAGKSHALFGAGEYMSSSLFLRRAITIFPGYASFKIDIVKMVGDRDALESRIVNVQEWLRYSGASELYFLLGYVYHQIGRTNIAKEAINEASKKMADDPAVAALKKVIDKAN